MGVKCALANKYFAFFQRRSSHIAGMIAVTSVTQSALEFMLWFNNYFTLGTKWYFPLFYVNMSKQRKVKF